MKKIVLTGACGNLGRELRSTLAALADQLLSVDIQEPAFELRPNETFAKADCTSMEQVLPLVAGADMIVHFASVADERPFEELLGPNYLSSYTLWEAGYRQGVKRIIYASSVHAVGMAAVNAGVDTDTPHAPDTFYGLAKCFTEDLGKLYWAKRGIESVHLRIFSCTKAPENVRALRTWLSHDDLRHLVQRSVLAHTVGFTVIYGVSNNDQCPVSNHKVAYLGYKPKDNAEDWAETLLATASPADPQDLAQMCLGGPFATVPLGESGVAGIKAMSAKGPVEAASAPPEATSPQTGKLPSFLSKKGMNG